MGSPLRDRSRPVAALGALIAAPALLGAINAPTADVRIVVTGLRSDTGMVRACMTTDATRFPKCTGDAASYRVVVPAGQPLVLNFGAVKPGRYAIALLHDENGNGFADRAAGMIPREGYGFSRDAKVRMGPPAFGAAAFQVGREPVCQTIRMRYML